METQVGLIIGALILTGIIWIAKKTLENSTNLAVITNSLQDLVKHLDNTVSPEIERLRGSVHTLRGDLQVANGNHDLLDQRVEHLELWSGEERRTGKDRREASNG